jgi:serine/threonine protein kinase/ABC-type phosphate/phosphonate transport system substrate-binding protein
MIENVKCRTCGVEIPSDTPMGQCPKCLFGLGVAAADQPAPARAPRCFAGYELVRQIGFGGMGVVYEARQPHLNRTVALKMILGGESCSPVIRRRFFIEAEAAARLDHPNIVPIYEVGEFEDQPFLSMKLIQGESLRGKMARGELGLPKEGQGLSKSAIAHGERMIARLVATLARAVHHAHTHNVVHRDLKPGNILFDANNTPYVTDFGLAKILDLDQSGPTARTEVIGTLAYMSPQQVRADAVTPATDIYSLGVVLYELLAGRSPFQGATRNETLRLIETQPPTRLRHRKRHIHKDLETICLKCLEKDSGNRYATAEALAVDLEHWLANQPIKARPASLFLRVGRWIKRNPQGTALILSLTLALFAAMVAFTQLESRYESERGKRLSQWATRLVAGGYDPSPNLVVAAEDIADMRFRGPLNTNGARRLTLATNIREDPFVQTMAYGALLEYLQKRMSHTLGQPIIFDLRLCKISQLSFREIVSGRPADFQRLGAVPYLQAKELSQGVAAVLQEDVGKEAVVFVRSDSPITNLSQFTGRSFAFGDTNSTINVWTKVHLKRAGVYRSNLLFYTNFNEPVFFERSSGTNQAVSVSGMEAAWGVLSNEFDGAVLQRQYFEKMKYKKPGLREVCSFAVTTNVWVARASIESNVVQAFQEAMLSIKDPRLLEEIPDAKPSVKSVHKPDEQAFEELRAADNEVAQFEGAAPAPPPAVRDSQGPAP